MNKFLYVVTAAAITLSLTSCGGLIATSPGLPQTGATSEDYQVVVSASDELVAAAGEFVPESAVVSVETSVKDLEVDYHRMPCSDTTSQYTNTVDYYLADGTDEIAIIDEIRQRYEAAGWQRGDSVAEQTGKEQDPAGTYAQLLRSPEGYTLDVSRSDDGKGGTLIQMSVFSPCIGNPTDKPSSWGQF
jgi:hypothetical protein